MAALYFLLVCVLSAALTSADRARFVPFGVEHGDAVGSRCFGCDLADSVPFAINIAGVNLDTFRIHSLGYIYNYQILSPYDTVLLFVSPAANYFDTQQDDGGSIYFGPRTDAAFLATMSRKISNTFQGVRAYVATWDNVTLQYYTNGARQSVQLVLIADASGDTWAFFYYGMLVESLVAVGGRDNWYYYGGEPSWVAPADDLLVHVSSAPPTFSPIPVDVCGDGVVSANEQCDGGECCTSNCTFKDTAYCYCERQTFVGGEYAQNYFCDSSRPTQFYQCLQGPWSPMSSLMACPAGTSCGCANGSECSCGGAASPCVTAGTQQTC